MTKPRGKSVWDVLGAGNIKAPKRDRGAARNYLMWVGSQHYPSVEHFIKEARERGISKRLNMVTPHLIPGQTRIYLAHPRLYETAAEFLAPDAETGGIKHPKISTIKVLRKIGEEVLQNGTDAGVLQEQLEAKEGTAWDLWKGRRIKCRQMDGEVKRRKVGYAAELYRLLFGNKKDPRFEHVVGLKASKSGVRVMCSLLDFKYRGDPKKIPTYLIASAMEVCADFVEAIDAGKGIFGVFQLECLEYIIPPDRSLPKHLEDQGYRGRQILELISESDGGYRPDDLPRICRVVSWEKEEAYAEAPRGCGYRKQDGVYAVSYAPRVGLELQGPLKFAEKPVPAVGLDYYRGLRSVPDDLAKKFDKQLNGGEQ